MPFSGYKAAWTNNESLETLVHAPWMHDAVPEDRLHDRAAGWARTLYEVVYPHAQPKRGQMMLEVGPGLGWIAECLIDRFGPRVVGAEISPNMVRRARERFLHPGLHHVLYDGIALPFPDRTFAGVFSCGTIQHIEKHAAFLLFLELNRVLAPGGHAVLHVAGVNQLSRCGVPYARECLNRYSGPDHPWHHYYSFDELFVLFAEEIGVSDLDIQPYPDASNFFVCFSKGGGSAYRRPGLPDLTFARRLAAPPSIPSRLVRLTRRSLSKARRAVSR
jgi:SAM-dependent methyltransferase